MNTALATTLEHSSGPPPEWNDGRLQNKTNQTLLQLAEKNSRPTDYSPSLPSYAVTRRQQVAAYAVIDSLGRNLTQPMGFTISLQA